MKMARTLRSIADEASKVGLFIETHRPGDGTSQVRILDFERIKILRWSRVRDRLCSRLKRSRSLPEWICSRN